MLQRALKTRWWHFKKLSSTYYPLCNVRHQWKRLSLEKNHESLAFSQAGRWKHSRSRTSASLSHRYNSSTECFTILCQVLISWQHKAVSGPRSACPLYLFGALLFSSTTQPTLLTAAKLLLGSPGCDNALQPRFHLSETPRGDVCHWSC